MPVNSDIMRAGMGQRVVNLASEGHIPPRISEIISEESGHDISIASVRRHLTKSSTNAASSTHGEKDSLELLAAAINGLDQRDTGTSSYYGLYKLDTTNVFTKYYGIARGLKNDQVLRAFKNVALKVTNGAKLVGDEKDETKIAELDKAINFSTTLQDIVRSVCEMGTAVVEVRSTEGVYIIPQIMPMRYITLLTDHETPGEVDDKMVHGNVTKAIFNEGDDGQIIYERDDIALFRMWAGGNAFTDIKGRKTDGIYGESMTRGVETPLKSLLNSAYYYDAFIRRYGLGRLHINLTLLADLIKEKSITPTAARATQEADTAALQKLNPNEDIVSTGREVSMVESKTGFDIVPYLQWRGRQVDRALLQSDVSTGDVGSAWTSAGTAVSLQDYDNYKSLRETLFAQFFEQIVSPRLPEFGLYPETVSIVATPFLRVDVPFNELIEMHDRGVISESELRDRAGFPLVKPDDDA